MSHPELKQLHARFASPSLAIPGHCDESCGHAASVVVGRGIGEGCRPEPAADAGGKPAGGALHEPGDQRRATADGVYRAAARAGGLHAWGQEQTATGGSGLEPTARHVTGRQSLKVLACGHSRSDREKLDAAGMVLAELGVAITPGPRPGSRHGTLLFVAAELDDAACELLITMRQVQPQLRLLLITSIEVANLVRLGAVTVDGIADIAAGPLGWLDALQRMGAKRDRALRQQLASQIRRAPHLNDWLRLAGVRLAVTVPPIRSVNMLAKSLGCSTVTLRTHYSNLKTGWRLQDLVDWFILYYYGWPSLRRLSLSAAATESPPAYKTLESMTLRLLGTSHSDHPPPKIADHATVQRLISTEQAAR